jgi:enediyne biosynthesis protein E4
VDRRFAILVVVLVGCPPVEDVLEDRCVSDVPWSAGTPVFRDATDAWGMTDLNVLGHQINVTDLEGDGLADLIVHTEGGHDDFAEDGERVTWVLRNTGSRFEDVTESSNFRVRRDPAAGETWGRQGTIMASADVDNDGDVDVYTAHWAWNDFEQTDWSETVLNDGTGHFELGPADGDHRREGENPTRPASVAFTDYDRDGYVDLWLVQNGFLNPYPDPDILFEGRGDGSFRDVTARRGIETLPWTNIGALNQAMGHTWGWAATACDLDNDGLPELLTASYGRTPNQLWRPGRDEEGRVVFTNDSVASGYAYDDNGDWTDDVNARCYCADNPSAGECDQAQPPPEPYPEVCEGIRAGFGGNYRWDHSLSREPLFTGGVSGTTTCADINNDGHMDLLTSEIVHPDVGMSADVAQWMENTGEAEIRFERRDNEEVGLARPYTPSVYADEGVMNNNVFDFDNDGRQDVWWAVSGYPGNHGHLYRQTDEGLFSMVDVADGIDHYSAHNTQAVDLDRDGDLDLLVGHMPSYCGEDWGSPDCFDPPVLRVYENLVGNRRNWVQLDLEGSGGSNRMAVGARAEVTSDVGLQTQEVDGGYGRWSTQRDRILHFGLGGRCEADVTIRWPDADHTEQTIRVAAGRRWKIVQGEDPIAVD